jgi:hypothetical protein
MTEKKPVPIGVWIMASLFGLLIIGHFLPDPPKAAPPPEIWIPVEYSLTGTARTASITIQNETGGSEQHTVRLPWVKRFSAHPKAFLYLSAQNDGRGRLVAIIKSNGEVLQQAEATSEFGIASVSGSVK